MTASRLAVHGVAPADLVRTGAAFLLAACVEVGLHVVRLPRLARLLGVPLETGVGDDHGDVSDLVVVPRWARRRLGATRRALRYWPMGDSCLRVALVGGCLVRSLHPVLRIGVATYDGEVKAHAWLEIGGRSLDPASADFAPVESIRA